MLGDFFQKIDKIIENNDCMPACNPNEDVALYSINKNNRILFISDKQYLIPAFFNIENAINGDFKTLDYIFSYFNLDIYKYDKRYKL